MNNQTIDKISFKNLYAFGKKLPIDLSLSENPLGYSPKVECFLSSMNTNFSGYPDPSSLILKEKIAQKFNLPLGNVFISNGSEAIIKLLPEAILKINDDVVIPSITFPMFEIPVRLQGNKIIFSRMTKDFDIDLDDIKRKISNKTRLIFICNPNNPTGKILPRKLILQFVQSVNCLVVVDEANIEFGGESVISDVKKIKNLIILRTFSKGYGLAGFRVGFCVADQKIIQELESISTPFPVSSISVELACIALSDDDFIIKTREFIKKERDFLSNELRKRAFKVINSQANNLLVKINNFTEPSEFVRKLNRQGVSVVKGNFFGIENFIRVSPRLRKTNRQFLTAIDKIINYNL
jgi:histidinol-phosphate aminotransferase